jgi:hypothetical protein
MSSEKIEAFWENATADDVARVMKGETVEARFRDDEHCGYTVGLLAGWTKGEPSWLWCDRAQGQSYFEQCQVYREPSWYANKPDPGAGYRLLGKFPDEPVRGGDFIYGSDCVWVELRNDCNPTQGPRLWYRRRIEPVEPVESKPVLIRRRVIEIGDEIKLPNGRVLVFNGEGFEVTQ